MEPPEPRADPPVRDFDPRFFYYDQCTATADDLYGKTDRYAEEEKSIKWELEGQDLELGMTLDPPSCAAKARKRKSDPSTEGEKPPVRRRPDATPSETASAESPGAIAAASVASQLMTGIEQAVVPASGFHQRQ